MPDADRDRRKNRDNTICPLHRSSNGSGGGGEGREGEGGHKKENIVSAVVTGSLRVKSRIAFYGI